MVKEKFVLRFENETCPTLQIIFDPPCVDYILSQGQSLYLKIEGFQKSEKDMSEIINVRYSSKDIINVDIDVDCKLSVIYNNEEQLIWGFPAQH